MKKLPIIFVFCLLCVGCGVKSEPEYKSQAEYIKDIKIV